LKWCMPMGLSAITFQSHMWDILLHAQDLRFHRSITKMDLKELELGTLLERIMALPLLGHLVSQLRQVGTKKLWASGVKAWQMNFMKKVPMFNLVLVWTLLESLMGEETSNMSVEKTHTLALNLSSQSSKVSKEKESWLTQSISLTTAKSPIEEASLRWSMKELNLKCIILLLRLPSSQKLVLSCAATTLSTLSGAVRATKLWTLI